MPNHYHSKLTPAVRGLMKVLGSWTLSVLGGIEVGSCQGGGGPHVPITILIWVWEKKVQIFIMGLLWTHLKKLILSVKNAKFSTFRKKTKWKNCQNLAIFGQNSSRFCTPAESSLNGPLSFSDQKNLIANKTADGHFICLPKTRVLTLGAPCAPPKQNFSPKIVSKVV